MKRTTSINTKGGFFSFKNNPKPKPVHTDKKEKYKKPTLPTRKKNE